MQGTIRRVIRGKGFGFIFADERQYFFHHTEVRDIPFKKLVPGDVVEFQPEEEGEGLNPRATSITVIVKKESVPPPSPQTELSDGPPPREGRSRRPPPLPLDDDDREFVTEFSGGQSSSGSSGPSRQRRTRGKSRTTQQRGVQRQRRPRAEGQAGDRGEGRIRAMDVRKGYGFIETPDGDIFFHKSSVRGEFSELRVGANVSFVFAEGDRGSKADEVEAI